MDTLINGLGIYETVYSKEPVNSTTMSLDVFSYHFRSQAKFNKSYIIDRYVNGCKLGELSDTKLGFPCWRPNAIFGNRANGISTDRVAMGSGLFFFDLDFKEDLKDPQKADWNEVQKLDKTIEAYKQHILASFEDEILIIYKSITRTGLHIILNGIETPNEHEFKKAWNIYREFLSGHFPYLDKYFDDSCKNLNRAAFIGSDENIIINNNSYPLRNVKSLHHVKSVTNVQRRFAIVQCNVINNKTPEGRRYIKANVDHSDVSPKNIIYQAENFNTEIEYRVKDTLERKTLIGYVWELGIPLYCPNNYVYQKIRIGKRQKTITRLTANMLYLNGFNLLDNLPLVKAFFRNHIYPKIQQTEGHKYTLEAMYNNIESTLKKKLLPTSTKDFRRHQVFVTDMDAKNKLSHKDAQDLSRSYLASLRKRRFNSIVEVLYKLGKIKQKIDIWKNGTELFSKLCGINTYSNFRQYSVRHKLNVTLQYIINKYNNTEFDNTKMLHKNILKKIGTPFYSKYTDM